MPNTDVVNMEEVEDDLFKKFLRRIHKYSATLSKDDYLFYRDFYEDAQTAVMNKMRPYGYTEEQKQEGVAKYSDVIVRVADYLYSKDGAIGETAHTASGVTRQYGGADIPADMLRTVTPFVDAF